MSRELADGYLRANISNNSLATAPMPMYTYLAMFVCVHASVV